MTGRRAVRVLLVGALLAGCGVSSQDAPEPVPAERLPSSVRPSPAQAGAVRGRVWSARRERLVPVTVDLGGPDAASRARALLSLAGPAEQPPSELPLSTRLLSVRQEGDLVALQLSREAGDVPAARVALALGQVVLTLTEDPAVRRVQVQAEDRVLTLLDGSGRPVQRPLERADFAGLVAPP